MVSHLSAGAVSGLLSSVVLQPFDLLKTRVQQTRKAGSVYSQVTAILRNEGVWGLWRGAWPSMIRTSVGSALYFQTLAMMRKDNNTAMVNLITGASARAAVGFVMMPITIVKVRFESSLYTYNTILHATRDIFRGGGVNGFFAGFGVTALRDAPYAGIYVFSYEACKKTLPGNSLPVNFASGAGT
ncbi:Solute carrier family 25 member 38 [Neolecta irregularis DAH-3]|uniref:Solute carrier family 25 member 38 n=1 Tax=Neolecta irregularis (strain DAH-3) TaxID=1198029 RepID=A0A1U7LSG4_NEOID|nr:Solute carrier family 25 member 38 [Neolecta irregularis DAH-3]|eukprot:OLL25558.1 Solute carrier family 25 member 38 [Neolecta irregularis DAH-3]